MVAQRDHFPIGVAEQLGWYVYRLVDPRNGETFYVGKGTGNRIFDHGRGALSHYADEGPSDLRIQRIKEILATGLEVIQVIHRHKIDSEEIAYQIEAALIDAYPGLTNKAKGHDSGDYGVRHIEQLIAEYSAEAFDPLDPLILISIGRSFEDETADVYQAVRAAWKLDLARVGNYELVLAHRRGIVVGVFRPTIWHPALRRHFPWLEEDIEDRVGFDGVPAEESVASRYLHKRVPDAYRRKGAANPVKYISPEGRESG